MNLTAEIWKPIPGYSNYEVSQYGRVRSLKHSPPKILKQALKKGTRKGSKTVYLRVGLEGDTGRRKNIRVHRAVLLAFVGPPPSSKHVGSHIDGNSLNNWLLNLKWATQLSNEADKRIHGTYLYGQKIHNAKLTPAGVRRIRAVKKWDSKTMAKMMAALGVSRTTIRDVLRGRTWTHVK
jgi:hypothetical protein